MTSMADLLAELEQVRKSHSEQVTALRKRACGGAETSTDHVIARVRQWRRDLSGMRTVQSSEGVRAVAGAPFGGPLNLIFARKRLTSA
jgi:hypothetical protein